MAARRRFVARFLIYCVLVIIAIPVALILPLRWLPPLTTSFMVITWFTKAEDAGPLRYDWVGRKAISRRAPEALVAAEDQRFFEHHGFDLPSIRKAYSANQRGKRIKGASTISQQVSKNLFLWPGRSWLRKGLEAWFTLWLELLLPKERILELYANVAQFGPATFGVEAASRHYYGKPAARLNRNEAALLAAVLPNPVKLRVANPGPYVRRRQAWIMNQSMRVARVTPIAASFGGS